MLAIVNIFAILVVSSVVAYQLYDTMTRYKEISKKLASLEDEDETTKSLMGKTTKDLSTLTTSINNTSSKLTKKVNQSEEQFNKTIENTQTFMTTEFKKQQDIINDIKKKHDSLNLDKFFQNMSQQVVTKNVSTDSVNLGQNHNLKADNEWIRIMDKEGKNMYGGFATNKLFVGEQTQVNKNIDITNGKINFVSDTPGAMVEKSNGKNDDRYGIGQFPNGAMRVYTSSLNKPATVGLSLAKADGGMDDVLSVTTDKLTNVYGNMDLRGKMYIGRVDGSTEPYTFEKNKSSLRVTINDNANETFEIWGDACRTGNCRGEGALRHKFQANGDASHVGTVQAKRICIDDVCLGANELEEIKSKAGLNI